MRHGSDDAAVLEDWGAAHALDDAAGLFQHSFVVDLKEQVPSVVTPLRINPQNFHRLRFHLFPVHVAADDCRTRPDGAPLGHRHRLAWKDLWLGTTQHAAVAVGI